MPSTRSFANAAPAELLHKLQADLATMPPELRKAAIYILENPTLVSVSSTRDLARGADVKPNTLVRLARAVGFGGFEEFRQPFRDEVIDGGTDFPDRARWLQSLSEGGKLSGLYSDMANAALSNVEGLYQENDAAKLKAAADAILGARATFVLGLGAMNAFARQFAYLLSMALDNVVSLPRDGLLPADGLVRAGKGDVLLAMTFKPCRRDVVETVETAAAEGVEVIAISDSRAAPIFAGAAHRFLVPTDTPQFFTSTVALTALLETMIAFVIADAPKSAISNIRRFHERRRDLGIYLYDESSG